MKKNRNSPVHANEEYGKTDFIIEPLLPIGKENAITTQELMRISGCGSSRELRQRIALERERGAMTVDGLWIPKAFLKPSKIGLKTLSTIQLPIPKRASRIPSRIPSTTFPPASLILSSKY